jgi:hypothetical protein
VHRCNEGSGDFDRYEVRGDRLVDLRIIHTRKITARLISVETTVWTGRQATEADPSGMTNKRTCNSNCKINRGSFDWVAQDKSLGLVEETGNDNNNDKCGDPFDCVAHKVP